MYPKLQLKTGREKSLQLRHPWLFSNALLPPPHDVEHGAMVHLCDSEGRIKATGTYSSKGNIAVRIFAFEEKKIDTDWWRCTFRRGQEIRRALGYGAGSDTT